MIDEKKHVEADLLAAFAENALSRDERESVLLHLADCKDCRELLYLAQEGLPEEQVVAAAPVVSGRQWWFTWRTALVAACLVLTVGVVGRQVYLRMQPTGETVAKVTTENAPLQQSAVSQTKETQKPETMAKAMPEPQMPQTQVGHGSSNFTAGNMVSNSSVHADFANETHAGAMKSTSSGGAAIQPEVAQSPVPESYKVLMPHTLIGEDKKLSDAELAQRHQLHQMETAEVRQQDAISSASMKMSAAPQQKAMRKESFDAATPAPAPSASGASGGAAGYAPPTSGTGYTAAWDRNPISSQGASANTNALARPSTLPGGRKELDRVTVGARELALDESGKLFVSTDHGVSWREIRKQWSGNATMLMITPKSSSVAASQSDGSGDLVVLWNSANQAWVSADGGESWKPFAKQAKPMIQLDQSAPMKPQ